MDCPTGGDSAFQQPFADPVPSPIVAGGEADSLPEDSDAWRREVAARLERYAARRKPRAPRYPSLFLPFESVEPRPRPAAQSNSPALPPPILTQANVALEIEEEAAIPAAADRMEFAPAMVENPEPAANVIEFPRSAAIPVFLAPELAEPILDRPRIVEAPEILPPPPALGGILMEPAAEVEKKTISETPILPATIAQRVAAGVVDGAIVGAAVAAFGAIFLRFNPQLPPLAPLTGSAVAVMVLLWCVYQFLFVVHTGSTPGMRALKLRLERFDGSIPARGTRRWRVLASFLSASALTLGYLWSMLDENGLCWHDRITRTYLRSPDPRQ